ncbi:sigma-54-dependent Fis family transcriptional regulator [Pseudonocardia sp. RS010]|uniref:sigma-54-dependent Fis family transcriptional regulator n=1 Tax=Pseudonocardia sp. RS010 TaxID=3385979 RepID=UPI0039A24744
MVEQRTVALARERFLAEGVLPGPKLVRPDIVASWRRSVMHGLSPTAVPRLLPVDTDCQVARASRPVLAARAHALSGFQAGLTLTDQEGRVLERWVEEPAFARRLDARSVRPGACIAETVVGTNSSGTSCETGAAVMVAGHEHFSTGAVSMTTAGAPVRHPLTQRMVGTLNVTCAERDTHPLLLSWIRDLVYEIEENLLRTVSVRERVLLDAFLRSNQDSRHPVLCLDARTVIANAPAARMLDAEDQAALWELGAARLAGRSPGVTRMRLAGGREVDVEVSPVGRAGSDVGVLVGLQPVQPGRTAPAAGRRRAWPAFLNDLRSALKAGGAVLVLGEAGTGKLAAVRRVLDAPAPLELDAEFAGRGWTARLAAAYDDPRPLLLRRLDGLDEPDAAVTLRWVGEERSAPVVATARSTAGTPPAALAAWPGPVVAAPALRERPEDLPELLDGLTRRFVDAAPRPRWSSEAVQVLGRQPWQANLHTLAALVEVVLRTRPTGLVQQTDLPPSVRAAGARRTLSRLEEVETRAILAALQEAGGNKVKAARTLGIARSTLYRKVRALGLDLSATTF